MANHYLFIDGNYLREAHASVMQRFYGTIPEFAFGELRGLVGNPNRVYYYDAIDATKRANENRRQFLTRVQERQALHEYLNTLHDWHVREGFVSSGRKISHRQQKAVDVQLAVDALEFARAGNYAYATFILGDLDFPAAHGSP